jgi:regulator of protease activity HflC (stomatin/prohibitin superfamily)
MAQKIISQELATTSASEALVAVGTAQGRYQEGWRAGKPVEDPEKLKSWGFVTAKPSEYLVVVNGGRINMRRSGQGMRVWKWPWNSVAIVPTSLQQIDFVADQVTRERVGVCVSGVAVYRIAQPEIAFRVLNFTYGESAKEKLAATLREMFIGAARRLIANLSLEQCLQNRKESIAAFLMQEIAPVVSGSGRPDDTTDQGWGVVIDTIEIQDVKILSKQVFEHLQAPFRAEIGMKAEMAQLERQRSVAELRAVTEKQTSEAAILSQRETRILRAKAEAAAAESEAAEALRAEQAKMRVQADELERKEALSKKRLSLDEGIALRQAESNAAVERRRSELRQQQELEQLKAQEHKRIMAAQAELAALSSEAEWGEKSHQAELRRQEQELARTAAREEAELSMKTKKDAALRDERRQELEMRRLEAQAEAERQRALAEVEMLLNQGRVLRDLVTQGLPQIAGAFKQNFGSIHYTQLGQGADGGPFAMIGGAMAQVLAIAKSFGLDPARLAENNAPPSPPPADKDKEAPPAQG